MADFPRTIPIHMTSVERPVDEFQLSVARSGKPRGRRLYPAVALADRPREFVVNLVGLTQVQRDAVETFLNTNKSLAFNLYWPYGPATYSVIWVDSKVDWVDVGGLLFSATVNFRKV